MWRQWRILPFISRSGSFCAQIQTHCRAWPGGWGCRFRPRRRLPLQKSRNQRLLNQRVSSASGWREHPIEGGEKFHAGVDLAAPSGDPIGAFADGVVDYIGESPAYGLYLQLRHDGGVTSFYAHCSKLCVQQGQTVTLGEKIAEVGDTGETTGAHLHFELRLDGELLNPLYYIETE